MSVRTANKNNQTDLATPETPSLETEPEDGIDYIDYALTPEESRELEEDEESRLKSEMGVDVDGIFYKDDSERTQVSRFGDDYDIEDEFESLQRLHRIAPWFFVEPIALTYDEDGNADGYFMETAPGVELNDFTQTYPSQASKNRDIEELNTGFIKAQLRYIDAIMDYHDEAHGDFKPWNIKVDPETSRITGYDPVGFDEDVASQDKSRELDTEQIYKTIADL